MSRAHVECLLLEHKAAHMLLLESKQAPVESSNVSSGSMESVCDSLCRALDNRAGHEMVQT